jgi:hypothetical protein
LLKASLWAEFIGQVWKGVITHSDDDMDVYWNIVTEHLERVAEEIHSFEGVF